MEPCDPQRQGQEPAPVTAPTGRTQPTPSRGSRSRKRHLHAVWWLMRRRCIDVDAQSGTAICADEPRNRPVPHLSSRHRCRPKRGRDGCLGCLRHRLPQPAAKEYYGTDTAPHDVPPTRPSLHPATLPQGHPAAGGATMRATDRMSTARNYRVQRLRLDITLRRRPTTARHTMRNGHTP